MEHILTIDGKKYRYLKLGTGVRKLVILWGFASYKETVLGLVVKNFSDYTVLAPEYLYHNGFEDAIWTTFQLQPLLNIYFHY